jgi:hypothetical protein
MAPMLGQHCCCWFRLLLDIFTHIVAAARSAVVGLRFEMSLLTARVIDACMIAIIVRLLGTTDRLETRAMLVDVQPNQSPEPTAVGAVSSAVAVHATSRRWLSFFR